MTVKGSAKRVWNFLWHSDSAWSWLTDLILAFLLVRFVIFPLLSLTLATPLPLVVVESGSMEHDGSFENWWNKFGSWYPRVNLTDEDFRDFSFSNGFDKGDIIVSKGMPEYDVGDVIIFRTPAQSTPIIHRVVSHDRNRNYYSTKGDNNPTQLNVEEKIPSENVISKAVFRIPKLGWIKLVFVELFRFIIS